VRRLPPAERTFLRFAVAVEWAKDQSTSGKAVQAKEERKKNGRAHKEEKVVIEDALLDATDFRTSWTTSTESDAPMTVAVGEVEVEELFQGKRRGRGMKYEKGYGKNGRNGAVSSVSGILIGCFFEVCLLRRTCTPGEQRTGPRKRKGERKEEE
jgi:hypothetical protein